MAQASVKWETAAVMTKDGSVRTLQRLGSLASLPVAAQAIHCHHAGKLHPDALVPVPTMEIEHDSSEP
jgi:hypothetical protein